MIPLKKHRRRMRNIILAFSVFGLLSLQQSAIVLAGDWPQILGPNRDSQAIQEQPLAASWDSDKPKKLWRIAMGAGYAGAAIVDGKVFLLDRDGQNERLTAVRLDSGDKVWQAKWAASYRSSMDPDSGPRAVPTVFGKNVICYGAGGDLVCIDKESGKVLWNRALRKETKAEDGYFGAGSTPLVTANTVIANIGGKKAGIVGLDLATGKTVWQTSDYAASYASPVALDVEGRPCALVVTGLRTVLLAAKDGAVLGEVPFGARGPTVNAATPLPVGNNRFLLTASYGVGAHLIKAEASGLTTVWKNVDLLASQYNSPVFMSGRAIGSHGREDMGESVLKTIMPEMGKLQDESPLPGPSHLIAVGDKLLQISVNGRLTLSSFENGNGNGNGKLNSKGSFSLEPSGSLFRALPAFSNHILVVRQTISGTQSEFQAYQLP